MALPPATKTCRMCCTEIPQRARKCPQCHHFQVRWTTILYHPAVAVVFAILPMAAMIFAFSRLFDTGENYETYQGQIAVTDSQIAHGETASGATVAVIGTITNSSRVTWKEVWFHVDFLGAAGQRVDVGERQDYNFRLPAGESTSFKVSFRREFPATNYVRPVVRVVGAKDVRARW